MCGRYTLHTEKELLARRFELDLAQLAELAPRYNAAPTDRMLTVRRRGEQREATFMRWGLIPRWTRPGEKLSPMINARVETVATRRAYRDVLRSQRCLVPADGFYEWQEPVPPGRRKLPHWIHLASGEPFAMAGLWEVWRARDELFAEPVTSFTILTTAANSLVAKLHDRMPVILHPEAEAAWLDPALDGKTEELTRLLVPLPGDVLRARPVGFAVNSVKHDDPSLLEPGSDPQLGF